MKKTLAIIGVLVLLLNMVSLPVYAEQTDLERVIELIDALPETYQAGNGDVIAEIGALIDANGFTKTDVGNSRYLKFYTKHKNPHTSWLNRNVYQDRVKIDWEAMNPMTCIDMFEYAKYDSNNKNIEIPVEEIAMKPGLVMKATNDGHFPSNVPYGSFIGFYNTKSVQENFPNTFPDTYGEYYVTANGVQFGYSGISKNIGDITYNGGLVSPDTSYEIKFDKYTKYADISLLMSGITYLSGEYSRQAQMAKTTVYFADGTSKEQFHIIGPFCYSYKMSLYSTLPDKEIMYSEYATCSKNLDRFWVPEEANVAAYVQLGSGLNSRTNYKIDTTIGNATVVTIDADNKAVDRVKVEYVTVAELKNMGGLEYSKYTTRDSNPTERASSNCYFVPINKNQLKDLANYEENRDYYMGIIYNAIYPITLHAVTGSKTEGSSYKNEIADIEEIIDSMPESFNEKISTELKTIKNRYDFLLKQGVSKGDFNAEKIAKFEKLLSYNQQGGKYVIYVSPDGNDNASGSIDAPLKTLDGARLVVRTIKKDKPVDVVFLEGEYNFDKTVLFTIDDSGTEEFPITYKSTEGAVFTAADTLKFSDFQLVKDGDDERIATDLIGKLYKVDLTKKGIYAGEMPVLTSTNVAGDGYDDVAFYVNNKEQMVSQWPNGEGNYGSWVSIQNTDINAIVMQVDGVRSKLWQTEKDAYFEGYPSVDYSNERNNITFDGDLIRFRNGARFAADENHSRRYKVKHVLAELDVPGEWYIDRDKNVLYYYPIKDFDKNAEIKIATRKTDIIKTKQTKNVNFDGITFDKIRGNAMNIASYAKNVNIYNCVFTNITNTAVKYDAPSVYSYTTLAGVANYADAAENCEIRNNRFVNIGAAAINLHGGKRETLSNGNNVVANNYVYDASNKQRCTPAMTISGAYNYALNNEAHFLTFHALNFSGNENVIAYNEFYDALRDTGDCGVIYNGRQLATRGTEIAYNYLHDYNQLDSRTSDNCVGVYLDDRLSGISIHHNIIFPNGVGKDGNGIQNGGGHHNKINHNIIVDADEVMTRANRFVEDYKYNADCTAFDEIIRMSGMEDTNKVRLDDGNYKTYSMLGRNEFYFERYPEMNESIETLLNPNETVPKFVEKYPFILTLSEYSGGKYGNLKEDLDAGNDLSKYRLLSLKSTIGNEYIGNIANTYWRAMENKDANGVVYDVYEKFGTVFEGNVEGSSTNVFVDYENRDFRIKGSTEGGALDESFDLKTMGLQNNGKVSYGLGFKLNNYDVKNPKNLTTEKNFNLTYPENNGRVKNVKSVEFMWERPVSSDYFTLEVATDPQMNNIVYKNEDVYFNYETVTTLPTDVDTFYWRVTARNLSQNDGSKWQNADGVNVFHTYETAIIEMPASVPFNIEADFNVDVFNNEGETHSNKNNLGGTGETLGMYNLTNFKKLVPADGYYTYMNTVYKFPQVGYDTNSKNAVSTKTVNDNLSFWDKLQGKTGNYTYTLKSNEQSNYDKIKIAMSSACRAVDYKITVNYTDNTSTDGLVEIHQYYTTYYSNPGADIILTVDGVNYKGGQVSRYNLNKIYEATVDVDENKTVKSIIFNYKSGTITNSSSNNEYIFAITGVKTERKLANGDVEKPVVLNNYSGEAKNVLFLVTGIENGVFKSVFITGELANSVYYPNVTINIPAKVYNWTNRKVFVWENNKFAPIGAKTTFFK